MPTIPKNSHGFTLLELLIVIAIFVLLAAASASAMMMARDSVSLRKDSQEIVNALRLAQNRAVLSKDGATHGVHFHSHSYVIFSGDWSSPIKQTEFFLSSGTQIEDVAVDQEVVFTRLTGVTDNFSLTVSRDDASKLIVIESTGNIFIAD